MGKLKKINIYSWNVNGIRAVWGKGFKEWVAKVQPDILCLQETKISADKLTPTISEMEGYNSFWAHAEKKGYSGVCVYTKNKPSKVEYGFGVPELDREGRVLVLHYDDFTLLNIYYPNSGQGEERLKYKMKFYDAFLKFINKRKKSGQHIIFCGDLNVAHKEIDLADPEKNKNSSGFLPCEREWVDRIINDNYIDTFRYFNDKPGNYTWWDYRTFAREKNIGWRIDYFFVSDEIINRVKTATIHSEVLGSDHCPISISLA
ncbi:MAG: exodeoxyribonuclease III [Deltaproteobacteria bacterium]|nr:exodeoxyribonuclease III [Deltaproteobacteria bacterium]